MFKTLIKIKTLTPLWTGGVETGRMDRIHETGIIGGLRWWYEAIVRGLGGYACDPTSEDRCPDNQGRFCDACQIFGATGWKRRFNLRIEDRTRPTWAETTVLNVRPPDRSRGWYVYPGKTGSIYLHLSGHEKAVYRLASLFLFLENYGAIGARTQHGYGLFEIENKEEVQGLAQRAEWHRLQGNDQQEPDLPNLSHIGFFHFRFRPTRDDWWSRITGLERLVGTHKTAQALRDAAQKNTAPVSPVIRNLWRYSRWKGPFEAGNFFFGTSKSEKIKMRSKISISWAFFHNGYWHVRGWIWLPEHDDRSRKIRQADIQRFWDIICDRDGLQSTMHTAELNMTTDPEGNKWMPRTSKDVINILENLG